MICIFPLKIIQESQHNSTMARSMAKKFSQRVPAQFGECLGALRVPLRGL